MQGRVQSRWTDHADIDVKGEEEDVKDNFKILIWDELG